jgi:Fe-S cluster biogenesis protein NfuA
MRGTASLKHENEEVPGEAKIRTKSCGIGVDRRSEKEASVRDQVEKIIAEIRPHLEADGGNIELIDVQDGVVKVRLTGACGSCPMSQMTLKRGVEARLKAKIPEVKEVVSV